MRTFPLIAALSLTGALALSSCGSQTGDDAPSAKARSVVAGDPDTWPLTGLSVGGDKSSLQRRPALVVKMDNTASSAPQRGLSSADLVVEELVEGGLTRLAAFYYSRLPELVGPVRSMRASDIGIVSPAHASVVTSGAAAVTIQRIHGAGITFYGESTHGFFRDSGRTSPYNLMAHLREVAASARQKPGRPADYLPFGNGALPGGQRATSLSASFSGGHTTTWDYRGGRYVNENSYAADDDQFPADTVLVLRVQVGDAGYRDPAGNPVPETKLVGEGDALLFHGGRVVKATWSKGSTAAPISLRAGGAPLDVPPGHTWVELVPAGGGGVSYR